MRPHIAVVEDEPELLEMLHDMLTLAGMEVLGVSKPTHLEQRLGPTQPDVFLIDLMLPEITGIELAQHLQETDFASAPMIAMSASRLLLQTAAQSGLFTDALPKPFELPALLTCIERCLQAKPSLSPSNG